MARPAPVLALALAALLPLAACATDGGSGGNQDGAGCEATACADEVRAWMDAVRQVPGVARAEDGTYVERRTLRREAAVDVDLTLDEAALPRAEEIAEAVAEQAWKSDIAPLGGVLVTYLPEGGRDEERRTETFSFLLHEDEYTERWGPRPVG